MGYENFFPRDKNFSPWEINFSTSFLVQKVKSRWRWMYFLKKCSKWTQKVSIFSTSKEALSPSPSLEMTLPELPRGPRTRPWPLDQFQH